MSGPIKINFDADADEVVKAGKQSEEALSGVAGGIDKLGDTSKLTFDQMSADQQSSYIRQFSTFEAFAKDVDRRRQESLRDTQRDGDKTEKVFKETFEEAGTAATKASKTVERTTEEGFGKATSAAHGLGDVAATVFGDISSGSAASAAEVGSSLSSAIGSAALAIPLVGGAVSAVSDLVRGAFDAQAQAAEDMAQATSDAYDDMLASGQRYVSADLIAKNIQEITQDTGKMATAAELASKTVGLTVSDVIGAFAGNQAQITKVRTAVAEAEAKILADAQGGNRIQGLEAKAKIEALERAAKLANDQIKIQNDATASIDATTQAYIAAGLEIEGVTTKLLNGQVVPVTFDVDKDGLLDQVDSAYQAAVSLAAGKPIGFDTRVFLRPGVPIK